MGSEYQPPLGDVGPGNAFMSALLQAALRSPTRGLCFASEDQVAKVTVSSRLWKTC
jgi:hypothetical protein